MSRTFYFSGGEVGSFRVVDTLSLRGESLPSVSHLDVTSSAPTTAPTFCLWGVTSNDRYVTTAEKTELVSRQIPLGRPNTTHGAFIPIKKNAEWWALPQDARRRIFEEDSRHIALGMRALPAVSRRLHHCRDLGVDAPFDFLTWFDFEPQDVQVFDDLLGALRASKEWDYVEREVELRVERA
jgi:chlorite dismutase